MKRQLRHMRRAFTLIELTIGVMVGMAVATMLMALFNQHLAFLQLYRSQSFITEEAPIINYYVSRLVGKADRFRLHDTVAQALSGTSPVTSNSRVAVLNFRRPDRAGQADEMGASILVFEDRGQGFRLNYYVVPSSGVLGTPQWSITRRASDVRFSIEQGILRMRLTGPSGEVLTYSGAMQQ